MQLMMHGHRTVLIIHLPHTRGPRNNAFWDATPRRRVNRIIELEKRSVKRVILRYNCGRLL